MQAIANAFSDGGELTPDAMISCTFCCCWRVGCGSNEPELLNKADKLGVLIETAVKEEWPGLGRYHPQYASIS
jgi:hypothetical protein